MSNATSKEEKKKRIILIGRSTAGKTTLCQRINNEELHYYKTQTVQVINKNMIDTPGEYLERRGFRGALIVTSADADIILMVQDATEGGTMFPPLFCSMFAGKPCVGIITKADLADDRQNEAWKEYFQKQGIHVVKVDSRNGAGMKTIQNVIQEACKEKILSISFSLTFSPAFFLKQMPRPITIFSRPFSSKTTATLLFNTL